MIHRVPYRGNRDTGLYRASLKIVTAGSLDDTNKIRTGLRKYDNHFNSSRVISSFPSLVLSQRNIFSKRKLDLPIAFKLLNFLFLV